MNTHVIKERVKELIGSQKVVAALFYTFNFDADFFENYVLPLFLPEVQFGENKIQNNILWRKAQKDLPPVCVYCDFHAKKPEAPTLNYKVRAIDLKGFGGHKPCFHPKHSYLLLDNGQLIILLGSNNLTTAGWCSNLEGVTEIVLENGVFFPREFKDQFRTLLFDLDKLHVDEDLTEAEERIRKFLYKAKYTEPVDYRIFNSNHQSFFSFLEEVKNSFNNNQPFSEAEVIVPYYGNTLEPIQNLKKILGVDQLKLSIPFENTGVIGMEKEVFDDYQKEGAIWSRIALQEKEKGYRFNHSKVYRLLGNDQMLTIVGSVNFTKAATSGTKNGGNIETALLLIQDANDWEPVLNETPTEDFRFSGASQEEGVDRNRNDVPKIEFTLNWTQKQLHYKWQIESGTGQVELDGRKFPTNAANGTIQLKPAALLQSLADNAIIRFHYNRHIFDFFPIQVGIEARPLSTKLRLTDRQILQLWAAFDHDQVQSEDLEKIIESLTREADGEYFSQAEADGQSTINFMAAHMHGLIQLERNLFKTETSKERKKRLEKVRNYYLYVDNLDTLPGYMILLEKLNEKATITKGFYWLLLEIIKMNFYDQVRVASDSESYIRHQEIVARIDKIQRKLRVILNANNVSRAHLKWTKKMLVK